MVQCFAAIVRRHYSIPPGLVPSDMLEFSERILEHPILFGVHHPFRQSGGLRLLDDNIQQFRYNLSF